MSADLLAVVGGGTGGHVVPGVAVAEAWRAAGGRVVYLGSERGMEARLVPPLGIPFEVVPARRLKNASLVERLKTMLRLPGALLQGRRLLKRLDPAVVLGVGGYVSGPVVLAAALGRRPCAVAEQNARPGLTNRILSRFVRRVYGAFPEVAERLPARKLRLLGNPVRAAILDAAAQAPAAGRGRHLLILGGSQGARALNRLLPGAIRRLRGELSDLVVVHQTGRDKDAEVRELYGDLPGVTVTPFIDDMAAALVEADLVVARAGATTVAELACIGRPALFVPFPHAADDHQTANAAALVAAGAAAMEREADLDEDRLVERLRSLLTDPATLAGMGAKARALGQPTAAADIAADLRALAEGR
ncbi:MAG: undecaprenyldiphospho-muramoylpentapeptide beta-N-acetylglucosaminyltransferase [bacterium]